MDKCSISWFRGGCHQSIFNALLCECFCDQNRTGHEAGNSNDKYHAHQEKLFGVAHRQCERWHSRGPLHGNCAAECRAIGCFHLVAAFHNNCRCNNEICPQAMWGDDSLRSTVINYTPTDFFGDSWDYSNINKTCPSGIFRTKSKPLPETCILGRLKVHGICLNLATAVDLLRPVYTCDFRCDFGAILMRFCAQNLPQPTPHGFIVA